MASISDSPEDFTQRFRMLVDAVQDYAIYMLSPNGIVTTWNSGAERLKGYRGAEIVGTSFERFFPLEAVTAGIPGQILETAASTGKFEGEGWRIRKDGQRFWASVVVTAIRDEDHNLIGLAKVTRDLTERKRHEEILQAERNRLHTTLHSIADGVICTDREGNIDLMNPAAEAMTGWTLAEARGLPAESVFRVIDSTRAVVPNPVRLCLASTQPMRRSEKMSLLARDGKETPIHDSAAPIRSADGETIGAVLVFQDVTIVRATQDALEFNATHDALTLIPNRRQFMANLELAIMQAEVRRNSQILALVDLDDFKAVNDSAGHAAGDAMLREVAEALVRGVRSSDVVARLGGDEFAIILNGCKPARAVQILTHVLSEIAAISFAWEGRQFKPAATIGATAIRARSDPADLIREADEACYQAKSEGKARIRFSAN